jgi:hypothetical protein
MAAYFAFAQRSSDEKMIKLFFFKITNPDTIQQARCITRDSDRHATCVWHDHT